MRPQNGGGQIRAVPAARRRSQSGRVAALAIRHSRFAIREYGMDVTVLQTQDVYLVLKIVASRGDRAPSSPWAAELAMVPAGVPA